MKPATKRTLGASAAVERMFGLAADGQGAEAYHLVDELIGCGWSIEQIVTGLLVGVQRRVGERWQAGDWSVAREHAATAVVDDLLGWLGRRPPPSASHETVALVCAEGEWHVTPARMAALLLRIYGWQTVFLGGSTPADHLSRSLETIHPTYVAISCTHPLYLLGAARVAGVARGLDIPTIAGGGAFGSSAKRAERLGIDGWAPDVATASGMLDGWLDGPPEHPGPSWGHDDDEELLERRWSSLTDQAIQRLMNLNPPVMRHLDQPIDAVRQDLGELLRAARLAALCDDPTIFTDFVDWLVDVHPARGLPHAAVRPSIAILVDLTAPLGDRTQAILRRRAG